MNVFMNYTADKDNKVFSIDNMLMCQYAMY